MWSSLLALALVGMLNPVRLGVTLLVTSQPRPLHNLLAYWVGSLTVGIPALLIPLIVVHFTPMLSSFAHDWATPTTSPTARYIQLGLGTLALATAVLIVANSFARDRSPAMSTAKSATALPPLLTGSGDEPLDAVSAPRRLLGRARRAWENGSLWASWGIGLLMGPAPDVVLFALAVILASGAAVGTQIIGAVSYVVGVLAVVEIILVSHLVAPTQTQTALRRLHQWTSAHRRKLLVAILAVVGVSMLAHGLGG